MATTMAMAHPGSPTSPGPSPALRGSPAAPWLGLGSAASAIAGRATVVSQATATAGRTWRAGGMPLSGQGIDRRPDRAEDDGDQARDEQDADGPRGPLASGRQQPHRLR